MRKLLYILSLAVLATSIQAQSIYYVSPRGDDANDGSDSSSTGALLTWQAGFEIADTPGDTVFFMGGTWYPENTNNVICLHEPAEDIGNNGTYGNHIVFSAYPGEYPIMNCINFASTSVSRAALELKGSDYIEIIGLEIFNMLSGLVWRGDEWVEVSTYDVIVGAVGTVTLREITAHDGGGVGFRVAGFDTVYLYNCDSYNRCDSFDLSAPGGDADGFIIGSGSPAGEGDHKFVHMEGCRAWNNSDDGVDLTTGKQFYLKGNWFFWNGTLYDEGYRGDATGIKTAGGQVFDVTKRRLHNNVTAFNIGGGVAELNLYSPAGPYMEMYNTTSYRDLTGYRSGVSGGTWTYAEDSGSVISTNNLIYATTSTSSVSETLTQLGADDWPYVYTATITDSWVFQEQYWYNDYNPAFTITDADFTNLDSATIYSELSTSRKSDGSLPDITVLKLVEGSDLIDGGTNVGLPYNGDAPDVGAFEWSIFIKPSFGTSGKPIYKGTKPIMK